MIDDRHFLGHPYTWYSNSVSNSLFQADSLGGLDAKCISDESRSDILVGTSGPALAYLLGRITVKLAYLLNQPKFPAQLHSLISFFAALAPQARTSAANRKTAKAKWGQLEEQPITRPTQWYCHLCGNVQGMQTPACTGVKSSGNICGHQKCNYCRKE